MGFVRLPSYGAALAARIDLFRSCWNLRGHCDALASPDQHDRKARKVKRRKLAATKSALLPDKQPTGGGIGACLTESGPRTAAAYQLDKERATGVELATSSLGTPGSGDAESRENQGRSSCLR